MRESYGGISVCVCAYQFEVTHLEPADGSHSNEGPSTRHHVSASHSAQTSSRKSMPSIRRRATDA